MDSASKALALELPPGVPDTYANRAEHGKARLFYALSPCSRTTLSRREKSEPTVAHPAEKKALNKFLLYMSDLGQPIQVEYIASLAFSIARHRPVATWPPKPPGRNWGREFEKRNPILKARRVSALDWERRPNNIYEKITYWFEVFQKGTARLSWRGLARERLQHG
jgi:hypothetical protein